MGFIKPLAGFFGEDGGGEGAEDFAVLDAAVQNFFHFGAARVGDDAAVAERAGAPFGAALIPAEDFSFGDDGGGAAQGVFFRELGERGAASRDGAGLDCGGGFFWMMERAAESRGCSSGSSGWRAGAPSRCGIASENILPSVGV